MSPNDPIDPRRNGPVDPPLDDILDDVWLDDPSPVPGHSERRALADEPETTAESLDQRPAAVGVADDGIPTRRPWYVRRGPYARLRRWSAGPWTGARIAEALTAATILVGATFSVLRVTHFPDLVLRDNTPTGGDMGAHVFAPAYLRDVLLPHFQLSGWTNYWYAGFPLYRFYMVVPALMIVALNVILPYGIAFKIVTILGLLTLPWCCWAFGRLARFAFPIPELMALASLWFIYDESFYLLGGNVKSTMAGEFSFSIALSFAVLGLGLFARGLETGKYRTSTAVILALAMLCHGIVLLFTLLGALLLWLVWMDRRRLVYGAQVLGLAVLLSAFWVVPFVLNHQYMTDMKYHPRPEGAGDSFWDMFFPWSTPLDVLVSGLALIGFVVSVVKRHIAGAWLGIMCVALMAATYLAQNRLPVVGLLWNPRILPFLYLLRLLLMMVGIAELVRAIHAAGRPAGVTTGRSGWVVGTALAGAMSMIVMVTLLFAYRAMPFAKNIDVHGQTVYAVGAAGFYPLQLTPQATKKAAEADGWTAFNFEGYEGRNGYGEYKALVDQMGALGMDPKHGCGRAIYENNEKINGYGTTMALMLLPHWTNGCIDSMEGVYFEASGTTPYHFLTAAAVSSSSSNPVRGLDYDKLNMAKGADYMQTLGVRYLMAFTQRAKEAADREPALHRVASVGPWVIYEIPGTTLVEPLTNEPVVANHRGGDQRERFLEMGTSWFQQRDAWVAVPATDGPSDWQRVDLVDDPSRRQPADKWDVQPVKPAQEVQARALPKITVTNVHLGDQDLSFDVDRVGVPVLVKLSYFPNWSADGATGPYRAGANQMIVVPTSNHVHLTFDRSGTDIVAYLLTVLGIVALVVVYRRGDFDITPQLRLAPAPAGEADGGEVATTPSATDPDGPPPAPEHVPMPDPLLERAWTDEHTRPTDALDDPSAPLDPAAPPAGSVEA